MESETIFGVRGAKCEVRLCYKGGVIIFYLHKKLAPGVMSGALSEVDD
jgi:hypothetical protein